MKLPFWAEEEFKMLPADFTGTVVVGCHRGGVTQLETKTSRTAPKAGEMKKDDRGQP